MEVEDGIDKNVNLNFETATREELIQKIHSLQGQVKQLRKRRQESEDQSGGSLKRITKKQRQEKKERPFNFSLHPKRHVALKITYLGWDYQGLACQDDTNETIEAHLFDALIRTKLIESRATSNYHRCGRTDKGVSAFSQVISIDLRCKENAGTGVIPVENSVNVGGNGCNTELDYCKILNSVLPKEIRVIAWSPVRTDFSARFDCKRRTYRYYLPVVGLDIERMKTAARFLIGEHDYRNFCKLDKSGEKTTTRRILDVDLTLCPGEESVEENYRLGVLKLTGQAFLWHQIRCIVAILILVGKKQEEPEVVQQLLDISKNPRKPQYAMAVDFPLILFDVNHGNDIEWKYCEDNIYCVLADLQRIWIQNAVKSQMILDVMRTLEKDETDAVTANTSGALMTASTRRPKEHLNFILMGSKPRVYQKLLERAQCERVPISR